MELKIAILIILVSVTNVFATLTYSQTAKVTLDMKNETLEQVLDKIEQQSEFYFIFNQKEIDVNRVVSINAESKLIDEILPDLGFESRNYYARFLAVIDIAKSSSTQVLPAQLDSMRTTVK